MTRIMVGGMMRVMEVVKQRSWRRMVKKLLLLLEKKGLLES